MEDEISDWDVFGYIGGGDEGNSGEVIMMDPFIVKASDEPETDFSMNLDDYAAEETNFDSSGASPVNTGDTGGTDFFDWAGGLLSDAAKSVFGNAVQTGTNKANSAISGGSNNSSKSTTTSATSKISTLVRENPVLVYGAVALIGFLVWKNFRK